MLTATPEKAAANIKSVYASRQEQETDLNIRKPALKYNQPERLAHQLLQLYRSSIGSLDTFATVYIAIAAQLQPDQRRELHRLFREGGAK